MAEHRLPQTFLGIDPEDATPEALTWVLPVPYDNTTSYSPGARFGPAELIAASRQVEVHDEKTGRDASAGGIFLMDPVDAAASGPEEMEDRVYLAAREATRAGRFLLTLGGEHSVAGGSIRAVAERWPGIGVLHVDAHMDLRRQYQGTPFSHACTMRRVSQDLGVPVWAVGVRAYSPEEEAYVARAGLRPRRAHEVAHGEDWVVPLIEELPDEVHLSFDLDGLDPSVVPGTGTPVPGGLTWWQAVRLVEELGRRRRVVAADIVELSPIPGNRVSEFAAARLAVKVLATCGPASRA